MLNIDTVSRTGFVRDSLRRAAIARFLAGLPGEVEERNDIAERYAALTKLSDGELAALGIEREDVPRVAVLGADA